MTDPVHPNETAAQSRSWPLLALGRIGVSALVISFVVTVLYRLSLEAIGAGLVFVILTEAGLLLSQRVNGSPNGVIWVARVAVSALLASLVLLTLIALLPIAGHALLALIGSLTAYVLMVVFSPLITAD